MKIAWYQRSLLDVVLQNAGEKVPCPNNHWTRADRKARISPVEHPCHPYSRTAFPKTTANFQCWISFHICFFPIRSCNKGVGFIGGRLFGVAFESCFMLVELDVTCCSCWDKKGTLYLGRDLGTDAD